MNKEISGQLVKEIGELPHTVRLQLLVVVERAEAEAIRLRTENSALWNACNKITANTSGFDSAQTVITKLRDELAKIGETS